MDKNNNDSLSTEELLSLIGIYEAELEYRDTILYSRMFTLSYISLLIMLLPYWGVFSVSSLPRDLIIIVGILNEILTFIISIIHANRLDCTSSSYRALLEYLPSKYKKVTIEESIHNRDNRVNYKLFPKTTKRLKKINKKTFDFRTKFYKLSLTYLSPLLLCFGVIAIGIILLIYF